MITTTMTAALPPAHRNRLMRTAREAVFEPGTRLLEEGGPADRFWIIRSGTVALDSQVPGQRAPTIGSLGHEELLGWSWHFPPYRWQLGAQAVSPVRAWEFDAATVRAMCAADAEFGRSIAVWVGSVVACRLQASRKRLLDLNAPRGGEDGT
ncbi:MULTISPECIES: cyclic nucleotide-binding domain-containing protein [Streptomyces]|uniref:cyclic nucleotide-binding domain-containing protein n=1 Tax=Streptomyces TaxID=1883 RepID=UPI0004CB982F|nr:MULTISPECIES: cyclic nucleotide-binding domain-containing protein [Streptomyces]RPK80701.1 Cyclic nucleotide-binding domain protein [Streptomyces sp. ADI98-10]